jgi:hypothetical protein
MPIGQMNMQEVFVSGRAFVSQGLESPWLGRFSISARHLP